MHEKGMQNGKLRITVIQNGKKSDFHGLCEDSISVKPVSNPDSTCWHVDMRPEMLLN